MVGSRLWPNIIAGSWWVGIKGSIMSDIEYGRLLRAYQADPVPENAMRLANYQNRLSGTVPDFDKVISEEVEKRVASRPRPNCPPCPDRKPCPQPAPCPPCPKKSCPPPPPCPLPPPCPVCPVCPTALQGFQTVIYSKEFITKAVLAGGAAYLLYSFLKNR